MQHLSIHAPDCSQVCQQEPKGQRLFTLPALGKVTGVVPWGTLLGTAQTLDKTESRLCWESPQMLHGQPCTPDQYKPPLHYHHWNKSSELEGDATTKESPCDRSEHALRHPGLPSVPLTLLLCPPTSLLPYLVTDEIPLLLVVVLPQKPRLVRGQVHGALQERSQVNGAETPLPGECHHGLQAPP